MRAKQLATGGNPGPEGSVGKLASAEVQQQIYEAAVDLSGAGGMLHEEGYPLVRASGTAQSTSGRFLRSRAFTIEGGTSEIMRNILGERVLGLPPDIRADKGIPMVESAAMIPAVSIALPPSRHVAQYARAAEQAGCRRVWFYDSPAVYGDVWIALALAVAATETIGVGTGRGRARACGTRSSRHRRSPRSKTWHRIVSWWRSAPDSRRGGRWGKSR